MHGRVISHRLCNQFYFPTIFCKPLLDTQCHNQAMLKAVCILQFTNSKYISTMCTQKAIMFTKKFEHSNEIITPLNENKQNSDATKIINKQPSHNCINIQFQTKEFIIICWKGGVN